MVRALRTGIMLLTLLLVVVGGTGMVSVCPCHEEIFIFSCSCHQDAAPCECHGDDVPRTGSSSPLAGHLCEHRQLEINDLTVPVPHAPLPQPYVIWQTLPDFHHLAAKHRIPQHRFPLTPSGTPARRRKAFNFPC